MEGDTHGQATQSALQDEQAQADSDTQTQGAPVSVSGAAGADTVEPAVSGSTGVRKSAGSVSAAPHTGSDTAVSGRAVKGIPSTDTTVDWAAELAAKDAEMADMKVGYELRLAGTRNVKAAKALLGEYEDDIAKLKDAEPWLFVTQALMDQPGTGTGAGMANGGSAGVSGAGTANGAGAAAGTAGGAATTAASSTPKPQGRTGLPSAGAATDEGKELKRWREIAGLNEE